jgi:hypothetical protein
MYRLRVLHIQYGVITGCRFILAPDLYVVELQQVPIAFDIDVQS